MVDAEQLDSIFTNLEMYVGQLRRLAKLSGEELASDLVTLGAAKYYLQVAVECCIDAANHIIAAEGFRSPESYADSFTVLAENGIVEQNFLPTLHKMARMRNRLVHLYWEIDSAVLYGTLQNNLQDFDTLKANIYRFIEESAAHEQEPE
jgi:uncharacterized protein YutE (UPF0331/DUF86 family)